MFTMTKNNQILEATWKQCRFWITFKSSNTYYQLWIHIYNKSNSVFMALYTFWLSCQSSCYYVYSFHIVLYNDLKNSTLWIDWSISCLTMEISALFMYILTRERESSLWWMLFSLSQQGLFRLGQSYLILVLTIYVRHTNQVHRWKNTTNNRGGGAFSSEHKKCRLKNLNVRN